MAVLPQESMAGPSTERVKELYEQCVDLRGFWARSDAIKTVGWLGSLVRALTRSKRKRLARFHSRRAGEAVVG
jgi:hypothetical protein